MNSSAGVGRLESGVCACRYNILSAAWFGVKIWCSSKDIWLSSLQTGLIFDNKGQVLEGALKTFKPFLEAQYDGKHLLAVDSGVEYGEIVSLEGNMMGLRIPSLKT